MSHAPASGERAALRGFRWQYDHIAARVHDGLLDDDLVALRLTDPNAGRVDDLVLIRRGRVDAYQFKSVEFEGYVTFKELLKARRTRSGNPTDSLVRSLGEGWKILQSQYEHLHVHLVMQQLASVNDHLSKRDTATRPSPDHLSAFVSQVLDPIRSRTLALSDIALGWQPALKTLHEASGIAEEDFEQFLRSLYLDFGAGSGLPTAPSTRLLDIKDLSDSLSRRVASASNVVEIDPHEILEMMGWEFRHRLHSRHEFPVDLDTYAPLEHAIEELNNQLSRQDSGYIAVIGPPGAGKSTLLSQALTGYSDRVIRYYAYVPGIAAARTRLTGLGFLHDAVLLLSDSGIAQPERQLASNDTQQLRHQLAGLLDAASVDFAQTGRRTIIVVDGLDHVYRDYPGNDSLLGELPGPAELPAGVLFLVGSRTLAPLHSHIRQHITEGQSIVDLQGHHLSPSSVIEICRRAPITSNLAPTIHRRIAELSDGYPLALNYLLNRLRNSDGADPEEILENAPAYTGDIAAEYVAVWDAVSDDTDVLAILAICSRMRIGFTTQWLTTWATASTVRTFRQKLLYLFSRHHDGLRFFHDSFRQFAADRTAEGDPGAYDTAANISAHRKAAELCKNSDERSIAAEELYHRYCADQNDDVLLLAKQTTFREQYLHLRSPDLIRSDIELALSSAANRGDVQVMLRMLLSLVETTQRTFALENVDMPGLLYDAGLVNEAIAYCGAETRRVPLAHAYDLAARLRRDGNPAGRRIFDLVEHDGFDDPHRNRISGREDDAALAWARAASLFRPLTNVLSAARNLVESRSANNRKDMYKQKEQWNRYRKLMRVLVDAAADFSDATTLLTIDTALADQLTQLTDDGDQIREAGNEIDTTNNNVAALTDLRVRVHTALLRSATSTATAQTHLDRLLSLMNGMPLFFPTRLDAAELLARYGMVESAIALLDDSPYAQPLTVQELGYGGKPDAIVQHFRYWRLRNRLTYSYIDRSESIQGSNETPERIAAIRGASLPDDLDAIELGERVDSAVQTLARLDAHTGSDLEIPISEAWGIIISLLDIFHPPSTGRPSVTFIGIVYNKAELMRLLVEVVVNYGNGLPQRLTTVLNNRFQEQDNQWPMKLRLDLAEYLQSAGVDAPWYANALAEEEASAAARDMYSRLEDISDLARRYSNHGDIENQRRLVLALIPLSFSIGYRKDYQFDSWVACLGRALAEPGGDVFIEDGAWMARVLTAVGPMTEGAPSSAAVALPAAVAPVAPLAAVRIFEYLVRQGTVNHMDALAALVRTIILTLCSDDKTELNVAADMITELIAPTANSAYPELARAVVEAAAHMGGATEAADLATYLALRTDIHALPTLRKAWREGFGVPLTDEAPQDNVKYQGYDHEYGTLVLSDGRHIVRTKVPSYIRNVDDIVALRRQEAPDSSYSWAGLIKESTLTSDDVNSLAQVFDDGSSRGAEVLAILAVTAEHQDNRDMALRLAKATLEQASPESWSVQYGGSRQRAAGVAIRLGDRETRIAVYRAFAQQLTKNQWFPGLLVSEFSDIVDTLAPDLPVKTVWPEVRTHLEGITATLELPDADVLDDNRCRWWLLAPSAGRRQVAVDSHPAAALSELAVGHLSHPTWVVRDAATRVVIRALVANNAAVAAALGRFAQPDASDDILEFAGRCLAGARFSRESPLQPHLEQLKHILATHRSQILRDLAGDSPVMQYRPLSPIYQLTLPEPAVTVIGGEPTFPAPHENQYELLAGWLHIDLDTLLAVASRYTSGARAVLPDEQTIRKTLESSQVKHIYALPRLSASRAAFGRVLADLGDSGLLGNLPPYVKDQLRTIDLDLLTCVPRQRPNVIPPPPAAGHDQTLGRWYSEIETRLDEYITKSCEDDRLLIGERSQLKVLNWDRLEEDFECATILGNDTGLHHQNVFRSSSILLRDVMDTSRTRQPNRGEPLLLENNGQRFHQINADWLAFRPELAVELGWEPDSRSPGTWYTASGDLAVEAFWWVDGWFGRAGPAFDDTAAEGYTVILNAAGLTDISVRFGLVTRRFTLIRRYHKSTGPTEVISATRLVEIDPDKL